MISAQEFVKKWQNGMANAGAAVKAGVMSVQQSPAAKAAQNLSGYLSGVQNAAQKWQANSAASPLSLWQQNMVGKGVSNMSTGATQAGPKMNVVAGALLAHIQNGLAQLPQGTDKASRRARMIAWSDYMATFVKPQGS